MVEPGAAGRLVLREVEGPRAGRAEALVRVAAISLNRGEIRRARSADAGWRPGWDLAGSVVAAAADGSGPRAGARVVGMLLSAAWAELVAVPTANLAELPDDVSFAQAATLPIAGLTALYALEKCGGLLGRSVLITGASRGVGHFAVQPAREMGARVVALVRQERHLELVRQAGAHEALAGEGAAIAAPHGPYWAILDSVGGQTLGEALALLARDGTCVTLGISGGPYSTFDTDRFFNTGGAAVRLHHLPGDRPLARIRRAGPPAALVAAGRLRPAIEVEASWTQVAVVAQDLWERRYPGKAVLYLDR